MKNINILSSVLYNAFVCLIIAVGLFPVFESGAVVLAVIVFVLSLIPSKRPIGALRNEVLKTIFTSDLQKSLWPNNAFYKGVRTDNSYAEDATTIEIPQDESGETEIVENPKKYPLETISEEDDKKSYDLHLFATKPQLVTDLNQSLVSYDKRAAKLEKHKNSLNLRIANRINYEWTPTKSDYIRQTTSSSVRAAHAPGATGNRKRVAKEDIFWAFSLFNDLDIPVNQDGAGERRLLIPAYMYEDLMMIEEFINMEKLRARGDLSSGQIGEILGFKVYMRSKTTVFTESGTPVKKAIGAAAATTDNQSALFFHTSAVRYCEGFTKVYINQDQGQWLGGTMNAKVRSGATINKKSEIGVAALVEDNA